MASTTALYSGLSGLSANARNLDVIGNNISNVNTTAFKSSRMVFASAFARNIRLGAGPSGTFGGTNPFQVGLGVSIAGTQRDFSGGPISSSGDPRDLAIEGDGFFIVEGASGERLYTRAGAFRQNANSELTSITGERLLGYGVDEQFNVVDGTLIPLTIPLGSLTIAEATRNVRFTGNLNATGDLPTQGAQIDFGAMTLVTGPTPGGNALEATSLLVDIDDPLSPGTPLYTAGQMLELNGAEKGNRRLPTVSLTITPTTTVQDYMDFLDEALGLRGELAVNPDGNQPGVSLDPLTGVITIDGNTGADNDIDVESADIRLLDATGAFVRQPMTTIKNHVADGESVRTTFVVFDSLGAPITVDLTLVLDSQTSSGTSWRYYAEAADDTDIDFSIGTGLFEFDTFGQIVAPATANLQVDRDATGAADPLTFSLNLDSSGDRVTSLSDSESTLAATFQDGAPLGVLSSYSTGPDGVITGAFTNGMARTIGQVAMAVFTNPEGLIDAGANFFQQGSNSGNAVVTSPLELGAGRIVGGALEQSNVDLSDEFIDLILASTGYSAASRIITTTDELLQQLLVLGR